MSLNMVFNFYVYVYVSFVKNPDYDYYAVQFIDRVFAWIYNNVSK